MPDLSSGEFQKQVVNDLEQVIRADRFDKVDVQSDGLSARARRGIQALLARQAALQVVTFVGGVFLARILDPSQFGLFAIATFLVGTFAMLGDFGLAPSLIQRREEITNRDLQIGFTLQQLVTSALVAVLLATAPLLAKLYPHAPTETVWLVRALAINLYLTSWRSVSALQLERHLRFDKIARIEVAETLTYYSLALILAVNGKGVWSFVWATFARGTVGAFMAFWCAPWTIGFAFDREVSRRIFRFGIAIQFQNLLNQASGWLTPLYVGSLVGPNAVGLITWASSNGRKPMLLADNVGRVAFPLFSRMQADRPRLEQALARYLSILLLPAGAWLTLLATAGPMLVRWIYTDKWIAAVPSLVFFAANLAFDIISWMSVVALNSVGSVRATAKFCAVRSAVQIVICVPLVAAVGFNGVAIGFLLSSLVTLPMLVRLFGQGSAARVFAPLLWLLQPLFGSCLVGLGARLLVGDSFTSAVVVTCVALSAYCGLAWISAPVWLRSEILAVGARLGVVA